MKPEAPYLADALEALAAYVRRQEERSNENMLTPSDVAERLAVAQSTVYRLISEGELRGVRVAKGSIRVEPAELERFMRARRTWPSLLSTESESHRLSPSDRIQAARS